MDIIWAFELVSRSIFGNPLVTAGLMIFTVVIGVIAIIAELRAQTENRMKKMTRDLNINEGMLTELMSGRQKMTPDLATALGKVTGKDASFWMALQEQRKL